MTADGNDASTVSNSTNMSDVTNNTLSSKKKAGKDEDNIVNTGSTVATLTKDIVNIMEDTDRDALRGGVDASAMVKMSIGKKTIKMMLNRLVLSIAMRN